MNLYYSKLSVACRAIAMRYINLLNFNINVPFCTLSPRSALSRIDAINGSFPNDRSNKLPIL